MSKNDSNDNVQVNNPRTAVTRPLKNDSIQRIRRKATGKTSKNHKPLLTCVVCNGDAHGYNFDAISCESCKAFFRRNALRPSEKFKCRGNGRCGVRVDEKKRCKKCRLDKCLQAGMRKEWILTEEERHKKRSKVEENRRLKQIQTDNRECHQHIAKKPRHDDELSVELKTSSPIIEQTFLTAADWLKIKFIQNAYNTAIKVNQTAGILQYPSIQPIESTLDLFRLPIYIAAMRLITYFKQIPEFQNLNKDEQIYLVKLNTLTIIFLHSISIYNPETKVYHEQDTTDPLFSRHDWIKTINRDFHSEMKTIQTNFIEIIQSNDTMIKIFFLIILFSNNNTSEHSTTNIDTLNIFQAQNVYNELFLKYCLHYYGLHKSSNLMLKYITKIIKLQKLIDEIKYTIHEYIDITQLSPLMQTLM